MTWKHCSGCLNIVRHCVALVKEIIQHEYIFMNKGVTAPNYWDSASTLGGRCENEIVLGAVAKSEVKSAFVFDTTRCMSSMPANVTQQKVARSIRLATAVLLLHINTYWSSESFQLFVVDGMRTISLFRFENSTLRKLDQKE